MARVKYYSQIVDGIMLYHAVHPDGRIKYGNGELSWSTTIYFNKSPDQIYPCYPCSSKEIKVKPTWE